MEGKEKYEKPNKTNVYKKRKKIEDFPSAMNEKDKLAPTNRGFKKKQNNQQNRKKKKDLEAWGTLKMNISGLTILVHGKY